MQATVRHHDVETSSGTVLRDDGLELPYDATVFAASRLRFLRVGQRVRVELDESGTRVTALTLATF